MPGHRELHRSDRNAALLYDLARKLGMTIDLIQTPVDALGSYQGETFVVEVKDGPGKLRASQVAFLERFKGTAYIWRTPQDVMLTHRELHAKAKRAREELSGPGAVPVNRGAWRAAVRAGGVPDMEQK